MRHVAESVNIYDRGDAWRNLMSVFEVDVGGDDTQAKEGEVDREGDAEMGLVDGQLWSRGQRRRRLQAAIARLAGWLWPTPIGGFSNR